MFEYVPEVGFLNLSTGRYVQRQALEAELSRHIAAMQNTLRTLTSDLYAGEMSVAEWETAVALELKNAHLAEAIFARGGREYMGPAEWGRVGHTLREQYKYLDGFAKSISETAITEEQSLVRVGMYGDATRQSYEAEYLLATPEGYEVWWVLGDAEHCADCEALAAGSPYQPDELDQVPGDGGTQCLTNCQCALERREA